MSTRTSIKDALVEKLKEINGTGNYTANLYGNVKGKLVYWNEVPDFPFVCVTAGNEVREYLPAGFKWGFLEIPIWIYVRGENSDTQLEDIMSDIERLVDANNNLIYDGVRSTEEIQLLSLTTDEGLMDPLRIGEILLQVRYEV